MSRFIYIEEWCCDICGEAFESKYLAECHEKECKGECEEYPEGKLLDFEEDNNSITSEEIDNLYEKINNLYKEND